MKIACQRKWQQIFYWENGFLEPKKNAKDENGRVEIIFKKKLKFQKLFKERDLEKLFSKLKIVKWKIAHGSKVAMQLEACRRDAYIMPNRSLIQSLLE